MNSCLGVALKPQRNRAIHPEIGRHRRTVTDLVNQLRTNGIGFPIILMTGDTNAAEQVWTSGLADVQLLMKPFELEDPRTMLINSL